MWYGITTCCNRVLHQFEEAGLELDEQTLAEVRAVRAFYYYYLLSLFGNVPIMETYDVPKDYMPTTRDRKEVYDFVVRELRESMDKLPEEQRYSRFNKWAAKHLLAKVYLNAESWLGSEYAAKRRFVREILRIQRHKERRVGVFPVTRRVRHAVCHMDICSLPISGINTIPICVTFQTEKPSKNTAIKIGTAFHFKQNRKIFS